MILMPGRIHCSVESRFSPDLRCIRKKPITTNSHILDWSVCFPFNKVFLEGCGFDYF